MDIINRDHVVAFTTKDTSTIREIMAPRNSGAQRQSLAEATLESGAATQAHSHPDTEELYYILAGAGQMAIENDRQTVGPGDAICIVAGRKHQIRNIGSEPLIFLCCCVPAYSDEDTIMCEPLL